MYNAVECNLTKLTTKRGAARYSRWSAVFGLVTCSVQRWLDVTDCKHGVLSTVAVSVSIGGVFYYPSLPPPLFLHWLIQCDLPFLIFHWLIQYEGCLGPSHISLSSFPNHQTRQSHYIKFYGRTLHSSGARSKRRASRRWKSSSPKHLF